jgi:hypothetical protein
VHRRSILLRRLVWRLGLLLLLMLRRLTFERSRFGVVGICHVAQPLGVRPAAQLRRELSAQMGLLDAIFRTGHRTTVMPVSYATQPFATGAGAGFTGSFGSIRQ